jgi:hypothetical protein
MFLETMCFSFPVCFNFSPDNEKWQIISNRNNLHERFCDVIIYILQVIYLLIIDMQITLTPFYDKTDDAPLPIFQPLGIIVFDEETLMT